MEVPENFKRCPENLQLSFLMGSIGRMHGDFVNNSPKLENITLGELPFLMLLHIEGNKTQKEIADLFCFTESNAAKIIRNLEDKNLIERVVDNNNRRKKIVSLTAKGKKTCEELLAIEKEWEKIITEKFTIEEKSFINEALHYMFLRSIYAKNLNGDG